MVFNAPGLIPARFLTLLSHLTVLILIFSSRKDNVDACMTTDWTESDFQIKDYQLVVGLIASLVLLGIELIGFLSGVSMFKTATTLISIAGHFCGSIALSYFIFDQWDCNLFWWVFAFSSVIPASVEILVGIQVLALHKT